MAQTLPIGHSNSTLRVLPKAPLIDYGTLPYGSVFRTYMILKKKAQVLDIVKFLMEIDAFERSDEA